MQITTNNSIKNKHKNVFSKPTYFLVTLAYSPYGKANVKPVLLLNIFLNILLRLEQAVVHVSAVNGSESFLHSTLSNSTISQ